MILATAAILLISGCATPAANPGDAKTPPQLQTPRGQTQKSRLPEKSLPESQPGGNSYYHYIEAQLQTNLGNLDAAIEHLIAANEADPGVAYLKKELAVLYLHKRDYEKSLEIVKQILDVTPEAVDVLFMKASIHQVLDTEADVASIYERILSLDPQRKEAYKILGKLYMDEGALEKAADVFTRMVSRFPQAYVGHYHLGRIHSQLGHFGKAQAAFERTIDLAPSLNQPRWELIELYQSRGNEQKVMALYEEILEQNPQNVVAAIELSLNYYSRAQDQKADRILAGLGLRSADDASVIRTIMQHLVLNKRYDDALTVLNGMREGAPATPGLQYATGVVYFNLDQYPQAIDAFKAVAKDSTFYLNAVIHRGIIAYQQDALEQAIEVMAGALDSVDAAGKREIIPYLSSFYEEKGAFAAAEALIREGLEIAPKDTDLHFQLGVLFDKQGRTDAAIDTMQQVLEMDPDHADALNYIGYTYADKGEHLDQAEKMIRQALAQKPENGYIIDSLGWLYYKKEMYEKAASYIEKAARLVPDDPIVLEHLGDVYGKLGKFEKAIESYQQALDLKPENAAELERKMRVLMKNGS